MAANARVCNYRTLQLVSRWFKTICKWWLKCKVNAKRCRPRIRSSSKTWVSCKFWQVMSLMISKSTWRGRSGWVGVCQARSSAFAKSSKLSWRTTRIDLLTSNSNIIWTTIMPSPFAGRTFLLNKRRRFRTTYKQKRLKKSFSYFSYSELRFGS